MNKFKPSRRDSRNGTYTVRMEVINDRQVAHVEFRRSTNFTTGHQYFGTERAAHEWADSQKFYRVC